MFCDQDDIWLPDKIKKSLDAIKKLENGNHSQPALIYCDMRVVDANLVEIAASFIRYNALIIDNIKLDRAIMKSYAAGCSIIINNALAQVAAIKDVSEIIMHDQWLMILAAGLGKIFYLDEPLVLYRQHECNTLGAKRVTVFSRLFEIAYRCAFGKQFIITRRGLYTRIAQLARCADVNEFYSKYPELVRKAVDFENLSKIERCRYVIKYNLVQNNWSLIWTCICV